MILYQGQIFENSRQNELIERLKTEIYAPFKEERKLLCQDVINACDKLAERVLDGEFDDTVQPLLDFVGMSREQFEEMAKLFQKAGLENKCRMELSDEERIINGKIRRERYPLGILMHIAAGNVDALPAYSVIEGLLSGNVNILKLPMGDSGVSVKLLYELILIEPKLTDYIYVFDVPSTETETLKQLADLSDGVVVWGGDTAVKAARLLAGVDTKIIAWGHKLSFAYAELNADDRQIYSLAKEICKTNQLLCSSCQGIFVDTDSREELEKFAERFFSALKKANADSRPIDYGMKAKNAINIYNEKLEKHITKKTIFYENGISVIISNDSELELSYLYRNVWIKPLAMDKIYTLKKYKNHLQTAAVLAADKDTEQKIQSKLANAGVVRITSPENMSRAVCGEAHDGTYALREYSRIVEFEIS